MLLDAGRTLRGRIERTIVHGTTVVADGRVAAEPAGRLVTPEPTEERPMSMLSVTAGPFSEAREVIGGFALVNVDNKEQAVELAKRFADLFGEVSVEVRRVFEEEDLEAYQAQQSGAASDAS